MSFVKRVSWSTVSMRSRGSLLDRWNRRIAAAGGPPGASGSSARGAHAGDADDDKAPCAVAKSPPFGGLVTVLAGLALRKLAPLRESRDASVSLSSPLSTQRTLARFRALFFP